MTAAFRAHGIPARARYGFATYLNPPRAEDHWVSEYWNGRSWVLSTPSTTRHGVVPSRRPGRTPWTCGMISSWWRLPPGGAAAPGRRIRRTSGSRSCPCPACGSSRGNLVRDLAALNAVEMLPWDVWGAQPPPDHELSDDELDFFDKLAELTIDPDSTFERLRERYATDERVRVPSVVFNSLRARHEAV